MKQAGHRIGAHTPLSRAEEDRVDVVPSDNAIAPTGHASFVDRLIRWIARLPWGGWWVYLVVLIASGAWATVVRWMTGVAPVGSVDPSVLTFLVFPPYSIALIHYLDIRAERALAAFAPALGGSERENAYWRQELTSLQPRAAAAVALGGALFAVFLLAGTPPSIYLKFSRDLVTTTALVGWLQARVPICLLRPDGADRNRLPVDRLLLGGDQR
jgi:hypothetical protein